MSAKSETTPPNIRRNYAAFMADFAFFGIAFTFFNPGSVLPAFVHRLTDSEPLIGLVGTVFSGGWLLPQLVGARLLGGRPRKKPFLITWVVGGRVVFWVLALALGLGLADHPAAMLALFFLCLAGWAVTDGLGSVAWFDILARALPTRLRGRMIGTAQFVSGVLGIGAGALLGLILESLSFPENYTLVFALAGLLLIPSTVALFLIREPPPKGDAGEQDEQDYSVRGWLRILSTDRTFRHLMVCRLLVAMGGLAAPFFVVHARVDLHLPPQILGEFEIAGRAAAISGSAALGWVCARWGPRHVIRVGSAAAALAPLFALAAHLAGGGWVARAYPVVYFALGVINVAFMLGFFNYLLAIAPDGMHPAYVGLGNTIIGLTTVTSLLGGWLLEATSYTVLFGVTAMAVTAGFVLTLGLRPAEEGGAGEGSAA